MDKTELKTSINIFIIWMHHRGIFFHDMPTGEPATLHLGTKDLVDEYVEELFSQQQEKAE